MADNMGNTKGILILHNNLLKSCGIIEFHMIMMRLYLFATHSQNKSLGFCNNFTFFGLR